MKKLAENIIPYDKFVTHKEFTPCVVTRWIKVKGYDLHLCEFNNQMLCRNMCLVYGSIKEFGKFIKERDNFDIDNDSAEAFFVWTKVKGQNMMYILITKCDWYSKDYGTICHELHHFTHHCLESIGIDYGRGGEELFAYFQGYYMELVCKAIQELKKANKKIK